MHALITAGVNLVGFAINIYQAGWYMMPGTAYQQMLEAFAFSKE